MSYSQGNLIEATDYNNIIGTSPGSTANRLNTVWAAGSGSAGYGQTPVSTVSASALVTAAQWASLINTLNSVRTHQTGSGSGISAPVAGNQINYLSSLQTQIDTSYTNRLTFNSNSAVTAGSALAYAAWTVTATNGSDTGTLTRAFGARATFASADQARYFFNAGGRLKFNISGTSAAGARSVAALALLNNMGGVALFSANTNTGRTGTGGTYTNDATRGYYTSTSSNIAIVSLTSTTTSYTTDTGTIAVKTNGVQGANNDNGTIIDFWCTINSTSGANAGGLFFDDSLTLTPTVSIDISYPEITNLTNSWGTVTITQL
jgi:hypothetical protein